jgi:hypothetical protein
VIQQRGGVQLKGGVGQAGDAHEQHADAVADKVTRGESAEALLDGYGGKRGGGAPGLQHLRKAAALREQSGKGRALIGGDKQLEKIIKWLETFEKNGSTDAEPLEHLEREIQTWLDGNPEAEGGEKEKVAKRRALLTDLKAQIPTELRRIQGEGDNSESKESDESKMDRELEGRMGLSSGLRSTASVAGKGAKLAGAPSSAASSGMGKMMDKARTKVEVARATRFQALEENKDEKEEKLAYKNKEDEPQSDEEKKTERDDASLISTGPGASGKEVAYGMAKKGAGAGAGFAVGKLVSLLTLGFDKVAKAALSGINSLAEFGANASFITSAEEFFVYAEKERLPTQPDLRGPLIEALNVVKRYALVHGGGASTGIDKAGSEAVSSVGGGKAGHLAAEGVAYGAENPNKVGTAVRAVAGKLGGAAGKRKFDRAKGAVTGAVDKVASKAGMGNAECEKAVTALSAALRAEMCAERMVAEKFVERALKLGPDCKEDELRRALGLDVEQIDDTPETEHDDDAAPAHAHDEADEAEAK